MYGKCSGWVIHFFRGLNWEGEKNWSIGNRFVLCLIILPIPVLWLYQWYPYIKTGALGQVMRCPKTESKRRILGDADFDIIVPCICVHDEPKEGEEIGVTHEQMNRWTDERRVSREKYDMNERVSSVHTIISSSRRGKLDKGRSYLWESCVIGDWKPKKMTSVPGSVPKSIPSVPTAWSYESLDSVHLL